MYDDKTTKVTDYSPPSTSLQPVTVTSWESFMTAIQFLTRIPVKGPMDKPLAFYQEALRKSVVFFPLVGGLIAVVTATIALAALQIFNPWVAAILAISTEVLLTGAFHEDAFADTCDGFGGGWTREQVLEIMKDSRLGTYGSMALILGVGLRIATTASLLSFPESIYWAAVTIIAAGSISRLSIVFMMSMTPPIQDRHTQARDVSGMQSRTNCFKATLLSIPFWIGWVIAQPFIALAAVVAVTLLTFGCRRKIVQRLGGTTGDTLGGTCYLMHLVLLTVSAMNLKG